MKYAFDNIEFNGSRAEIIRDLTRHIDGCKLEFTLPNTFSLCGVKYRCFGDVIVVQVAEHLQYEILDAVPKRFYYNGGFFDTKKEVEDHIRRGMFIENGIPYVGQSRFNFNGTPRINLSALIENKVAEELKRS